MTRVPLTTRPHAGDSRQMPRPFKTMVTTGWPGGVPRVKLDEPARDFPHLKTMAQILRSMNTKQRKAYDKANKAERKKMLDRQKRARRRGRR